MKQKQKQIPNCALCVWSKKDFGKIKCLAQGGADGYTIYNNKFCKKLYKNREEKQ